MSLPVAPQSAHDLLAGPAGVDQREPDPDFSPRRTFIRSFVNNAHRGRNVDRLVARPLAVVLTTVAAIGLVMLVGVVWGVIRPLPPTVAVADPDPTGTGFSAVAGWDCAQTQQAGFESTGRTSAWYTVPTGGWSGDGCRGTFQAIPLSGSATEEDQRQFAVWWFRPGASISRCEVLVYLPDSGRPADAAATAARYDVLAGRGGAAYGVFTVDQTIRPGRWMSVGSFPMPGTGEELAVRLSNRGVPSSATARLAVAQLKANCSV